MIGIRIFVRLIGKSFTCLVLAACFLASCSLDEEPEIKKFDWGINISGSNYPLINAINVSKTFNSTSLKLSYFTGGMSGGVGKGSSAPTVIKADVLHEQIQVRTRTFENSYRQNLDEEALQIAKVISSATTEIWPGTTAPLLVENHIMPDDLPFSLAKKINWQEGEPYELVIFQREGWDFSPITSLHEFYHVLAARWEIGSKNPQANKRINLYRSYEEVAGDLYAGCGVLLANGTFTYDPKAKPAITLENGRTFKGAISDEELTYILNHLSINEQMSGVRLVLTQTALYEILGDQETVTIESKQGEAMISLCKKVTPQPILLHDWFREISKSA